MIKKGIFKCLLIYLLTIMTYPVSPANVMIWKWSQHFQAIQFSFQQYSEIHFICQQDRSCEELTVKLPLEEDRITTKPKFTNLISLFVINDAMTCTTTTAFNSTWSIVSHYYKSTVLFIILTCDEVQGFLNMQLAIRIHQYMMCKVWLKGTSNIFHKLTL